MCVKSVYIVQHVRDNKEDTSKIVGIYSDRLEADSAVRRMLNKPGFKDNPRGFYIDEYELNEDNWTEGFGIINSLF